MKIQFGKHKGEELHTIPKSYLNWIKQNIPDLDPHLQRAVDLALEGKEYKAPTRRERIDEARQDMLSRLKARDAGRTLFPVVA